MTENNNTKIELDEVLFFVEISSSSYDANKREDRNTARKENWIDIITSKLHCGNIKIKCRKSKKMWEDRTEKAF